MMTLGDTLRFMYQSNSRGMKTSLVLAYTVSSAMNGNANIDSQMQLSTSAYYLLNQSLTLISNMLSQYPLAG